MWFSILGLCLAKPPNPIDSETFEVGDVQKQRVSRSIWPFTSWEATTEEPVTDPPQLENNQWFVQGETVLPQGIDLNRYPVWKIHKYHGIDLHPVKLEPGNIYPPELQTVVEPGYYPGSVSPPEYPHGVYPTEYQDYKAQTPVHETYPASYPTAYSAPVNQENYQTGEFTSSSFATGDTPLLVQTQHKSEVFAPPQPLTDFRSTAGPGPHKVPVNSYGVPNAYQSGVNFQGQAQVTQNQAIGGKSQTQSSDEDDENPNLSFLDDLGGLAPFLPDPAADSENTLQNVESETEERGFLENLFSRFSGATEEPVEAETEAPSTSGGFLSSIFGLRSDTQLPEEEPPAPQPSGGVFSSFFYQQPTEKPAVVLPTTYFLPKTKGSYIAVKLPGHLAPSITPNVGPGVANIPFHQVPRVPFAHHEIPQISGPTIDSVYPYNPGYSEERHPASNPGYYQHPVEYSLPTVNSPPDFRQNHGSYQQSGFQNNNGEPLDQPRAEYLQSNDNGQSISSNNHYDAQKNFGMEQVQATASQSEDQLPLGYLKTSGNEEYQNQNSNVESTSNFDQNRESVSSTPQFSGGFVPSLAYGTTEDGDDQSKRTAGSRGSTAADETYDNSGASLSQHRDMSTRFASPKEKEQDQRPASVYQISFSSLQTPNDVQKPSRTYELPPVNDSGNFDETLSNQDEGDVRFIKNLSALTSYGTPTNSYTSEPFVPASLNTKRTATVEPVKDEVNDGSRTNMNKDVLPTTLAERLNARKGDRVIRKVTKRMYPPVERNNWRRSAPERQAPTEEADHSMVIRSEKDSIPEVRVGRQFDGTVVNDGYSKVQQHQQREFVSGKNLTSIMFIDFSDSLALTLP